jgi:hypothetical protein
MYAVSPLRPKGARALRRTRTPLRCSACSVRICVLSGLPSGSSSSSSWPRTAKTGVPRSGRQDAVEGGVVVAAGHVVAQQHHDVRLLGERAAHGGGGHALVVWPEAELEVGKGGDLHPVPPGREVGHLDLDRGDADVLRAGGAVDGARVFLARRAVAGRQRRRLGARVVARRERGRR